LKRILRFWQGGKKRIKLKIPFWQRGIMPQIQDQSICSLSNEWQYLEKNPDSWRKQLFIKGRNIKASTIWLDMLLNGFTPEELAEDKGVPLEAVKEAIQYCQENQQLLEEEALEEYLELEKKGIIID